MAQLFRRPVHPYTRACWPRCRSSTAMRRACRPSPAASRSRGGHPGLPLQPALRAGAGRLPGRPPSMLAGRRSPVGRAARRGFLRWASAMVDQPRAHRRGPRPVQDLRRQACRRRRPRCMRSAASISTSARRDAGAGRRVRLRQVHDRPDAGRADPGDQRDGQPVRPQHHRPGRPSPARSPCAAAAAIRVPGSLCVAQSAHADRRRHCRAARHRRHAFAQGSQRSGRGIARDWSACRSTSVERYPHEFSGGQRQRIVHRAGARAATRNLSSATNRCRRWTSRCRRRSSICCSTCRTGSG